MFSLQDIEENNIKISVMYFVELLCIQCFEENQLKSISSDLTKIFEKYIENNDKNVKFFPLCLFSNFSNKVVISTVKAISSFLSNVNDRKLSKNFLQIIPIMLQILIDVVKDDEDTAITFVQSFGDLAENNSILIKLKLEDILGTFAELLQIKALSRKILIHALLE